MLSKCQIMCFVFVFLTQLNNLGAQAEQVDNLIDHAFAMRASKPDSSLILLMQAESLAQETNYLAGEIKAAFLQVRQQLTTLPYEALRPKIESIQKKVRGKEVELEKYAAELNFLTGTKLMQSDRLDSTLFYFKKSIAWYLTHDMKASTSAPYTNLAKIYLRQHNLPLVKEYILKADEASSLGTKLSRYITLMSLTRISFSIGDYEEYAKYLIEGQKLAEGFGMSPNDQISEHSLAKQIFQIEGDSLLFRLEESLPILKKQSSNFPLLIAYTAIGNLYRKNGDYENAVKNFLTRLELEDDIEGKYLSYSYLYEVSKEAQNSAEALEYLESYHALKDSLFRSEVNQNISKLQVELETVEKDFKIREQKRQRNYLVSAFVVLGIFGSYVLFNLKKKNSLNRRIFEQKKQLDSQKIDKLKKEMQLTRTQAVLEGQELERKRIASDLHDGLGGLLTTVKAHYGNIKNDISEIGQLKNSGRVEAMIDEACVEVRRISHDLMPNVLRLDGLQSAIEEIALNLKVVHKLEVHLDVNNLNPKLDNKRETFIFRIIQELANNIVKYANAQHVILQVNRFKTEIVILVEDDGIGFDLSKIERNRGLGIDSTRSRVDYLNGEIDINTAPGNGTSITINIPLD